MTPQLTQLRIRPIRTPVSFISGLRFYSFQRSVNPRMPVRYKSLSSWPLTTTTQTRSCGINFHRFILGSRSVSSANKMEAAVHELFEPATGSWQYVVADPNSKSAVIIDPVLNYDPLKAAISTESANEIITTVREKGYKVEMILETHVHADHITAASYIQSRLAETQGHKPMITIGSRIKQVQNTFGERYKIPPEEYNGAFDKLWEDDEKFTIGTLAAQAIHLPGHTPDHMGYKIGSKHFLPTTAFQTTGTDANDLDNIFVGDSIFNADIGSARVDFPGGSAEAIFKSCRKILDLPNETRIWVGHDYPPLERGTPLASMTVKQQKDENKHLKDNVAERDFINMRRKRDASLAAPRLLHPSLQINIRAGRLPIPISSGYRLVHIPLTLPKVAW